MKGGRAYTGIILQRQVSDRRGEGGRVDSREVDNLRWSKDGPLLPYSRPQSFTDPLLDTLHLRVGPPGARLHRSLAEVEEGRR
jgi:hypothetical protein